MIIERLKIYNCECILGWKSRDGVPKLVEEYLQGKMKVDEFVTHTFPLSEINKAFDVMHAGDR
jgi:S-(hydroxymethyl)glutathione dehydrogenase/alcohol dehydrogenase